MAKVAKNLRRLRTDCGMTQAQLAEKMHITRQAISNWENDKTQPDIDALVRLSEILNTEIEALIYGKRRHVGTDEQRPDYRIRVVLGVLGSLFVGIGLMLIFFNFWRDFPVGLQASFAVLPILLGQGFAVYVYLKQQKSVLFRESAAILWCVGVVSSVALVNSVFDIHCGFMNCLLLDIILCLPVLWLFRAVSPLAPYLYMVIHWSSQANTVEFFAALLLLAGGVLLPLVLHKNKADVRYKFSVWISTIGAVVFYGTQVAVKVESSDFLLFLLPIFAAFLLWDNNLEFSRPFAPIGLFGGTACLLFYSFIAWDYLSPSISWWSNSSIAELLSDTKLYIPQFPAFTENLGLYAIILLSVVIVGFCAFLRREDLEDELLTILQAAFLCGAFVIGLFGTVFSATNFIAFMLIAVIGFGVVLLLTGARTMRLTYVNLGMILLFTQCFFLLQTFTVNILLVGLAFVAFGALLIGINVKMARDKKEVLEMERLQAEADEVETEEEQ